jgi:hypothetical protein
MHDGKPKRRWQEVAEEASREQDPERLLQLTKELEEALDECNKLPPQLEPPKAKIKKESA